MNHVAYAINWTDLATIAQAIGPLLSTVAILAAIAAGVLPPRIAGAIDQRRWRATASRLAYLVHEAIEEFAGRCGAPSELSTRDRARDTVMLQALVRRCEDWPADSIGDPHALEAFIRLTGVGRAILVAATNIQTHHSQILTAQFLGELERLRALSALHFHRYQEFQNHPVSF